MTTFNTIAEAVVGGRSLIFVLTHDERTRVFKLCRRVNVKSINCIAEKQHLALALFHLQRQPTALIVQRPMLSHGVRVFADRVIWIGRLPENGDHDYADYIQSVRRPGINAETGLPFPVYHFAEGSE